MLMDEDPRVKGSVVPPDVPLHYVSATLRGNVSPTLADYSELALTFSPKLYAENPHCFAGSNYEIFSNPNKVSAALAMFAATFGPLADGFGYDGFDTFVAAVSRATTDLAGRRNLTKLVVDLFESGMRDAMDFGRASMRDVRLNAKFESKFDGRIPPCRHGRSRLAWWRAAPTPPADLLSVSLGRPLLRKLRYAQMMRTYMTSYDNCALAGAATGRHAREPVRRPPSAGARRWRAQSCRAWRSGRARRRAPRSAAPPRRARARRRRARPRSRRAPRRPRAVSPRARRPTTAAP
jgi:hypothetical protein